MKYEDLIREHLLKYGSITSTESIKKYGCQRLSHYIYVLRKKGMNIASITEKGVNRYGRKTSWCRYTLIKGRDNGE